MHPTGITLAFVRGTSLVAPKIAHTMTAGTYNVIFWDFVSKIRPGSAFLLGEGLTTGQMGSVTGCYKRTREVETKEEMEEGTKEESVEGKRGSTAAEAGEQELLNYVNTPGTALLFGDGVEVFSNARHGMGCPYTCRTNFPLS